MTVLPSPEAMIVICTVILIAYTAHVLGKAFAWGEQFEAMLSANERIMELQAENAKMRDALKAFVVGTEAELCVDRDAHQCKECSMNMGDSECAMTVAMELLSIDVFGEPVTYPDGEVDE